MISIQNTIEIAYVRQDGKETLHSIQPITILFSEYYFYLVAYREDKMKDIPIIFRIDRIQTLKQTKRYFKIPYADKFNDGEFRKRVQFMYSGPLQRVTFEFTGPSLEAILDRLPTAKVLSEINGVYTIQAESYGKGIYMFLNAQGEHVQIK